MHRRRFLAAEAAHRGRAANMSVTGNRFEKVGMHGPTALKVHPTARLVIARNPFADCGWDGAAERGPDVIIHPCSSLSTSP